MNDRGRDITDKDWKRYDDQAKANISQRIESARKGTPLHKLGIAAFLLALREAKNLGKRGDKTLREMDEEAYATLELRRTLVEAQRTKLTKLAAVQHALRTSEREAARTAFGDPKRRAHEYKAFLLSDTFWAQARAKPAKERSELMSRCLTRLGSLDPAAAEHVAHGWLAQENGPRSCRGALQATRK